MSPIGALALASALTYQQRQPAPRALDDEARRVEVVADVERSVVAVIGEIRAPSDETEEGPQGKRAIGAGVIVPPDGLVVTAAHVLAGADRVRVNLDGADAAPARVVFLDVRTDLALLRLEQVPIGLAAARPGDSGRVRKGGTVYVIGNPRGLERSLSVGVVSGRHSLAHVAGGTGETKAIQTDAAVNPGNSGGPIFNSRGEGGARSVHLARLLGDPLERTAGGSAERAARRRRARAARDAREPRGRGGRPRGTDPRRGSATAARRQRRPGGERGPVPRASLTL